jgi:Condensation domain
MPVTSARPRVVPLNLSQEWTFYREEIEGGQDAIVFSVNLPEGTSEQSALGAVVQLVEAHDALRTRIAGTGTERSLIIEPPGQAVRMLGWRTCRAPDPARGSLTQWHHDLMGDPIEAAEGAVRCILAVTPTQRRIVFRVHHAVCDGYAVNVIIRDVLNALCGAGPPPARRQSSDYGFERDQEAEHRNLSKWLSTLESAPANVTYTARKMVELPSHGEQIAEFGLSRQLTSRLRRVAQAAKSTFFALWLSLMHAWASQYTGEHDLILSMMSANRRRRDDYDVVADMSRPLWIRVAGRPGDTFADRLAAVQTALLERLSWTAYNPVHLFQELCADAARRGSSFRPAVNTSMHVFGGPRISAGRSQECPVACESSLAGPVRVLRTAKLPEASWSDLKVESVVKGNELRFWVFMGQALYSRRAPGDVVEDLVSVLGAVGEGGLDLPLEVARVPRLEDGRLVKDRRSGARVDLALAASVLLDLPRVTSAVVHASGNDHGSASTITADVRVEPGSLTEQTPGWLQREFTDRLPGYRGIAVPEVWQVSSAPSK